MSVSLKHAGSLAVILLCATCTFAADANTVKLPMCKSITSMGNCMLNLEVFQFTLENKQDFNAGGWNTLKSTAMQLMCLQHKNLVNCTMDSENFCQWHGESQACGVSSHGHQAQVACPGSKAREWYTCLSSFNPTNTSCRLSECELAYTDDYVHNSNGLGCVPSWYSAMSFEEQEAFTSELHADAASVWGCCASSRQQLAEHQECSRVQTKSDCQKGHGCVWEMLPGSTTVGACHQSSDSVLSNMYGVSNLPKIREQSRWCRSFGSRSTTACMEGSMMRVALADVAKYAAAEVENPTVPCWDNKLPQKFAGPGAIAAAHEARVKMVEQKHAKNAASGGDWWSVPTSGDVRK